MFGVYAEKPSGASDSASNFPRMVDSEFSMSGKRMDRRMLTWFSLGMVIGLGCLGDAEGLKWFLHNRFWHVKTMYAFVALPDLGSLEEWLPKGSVKYGKRGTQL